MKYNDKLRNEALEEAVAAFGEALEVSPPAEGWVRAVRETLGMTNIQLAHRLGRRAAQTVEDMQKNELSGAISLKTLKGLAEAMDCRLVYAVVPKKPFNKIRRDRARAIATKVLLEAVRPVGSESRETREHREKQALDELVQRLLDGSPKKLWE